MSRDPLKVFYGSSFDRGCEHLLEMWPDVKKAIPDATLELAYGWQLFDRFYKDNPSSMAWKKKMLEMMQADGVTDRGRLPQPEVEKLMRTCGIWSYPTHFGEINCINALKAQAFGCIPVVVNYAALETTVQFGIKVEGDIYDDEVRISFQKALIWALQHPEWQEEIRKPMIQWASDKFKWSNIAKQWDNEFKREKTADFWIKPEESVIKVYKNNG